MIQTLNHNSHLLTKLLLIGALICAYKYRAEIKEVFYGSTTYQEAKGSLKWLYGELRPQTETEKAQSKAYGEERQRRIAEYKEMGISPIVKQVTREDPEWSEAAALVHELKENAYR